MIRSGRLIVLMLATLLVAAGEAAAQRTTTTLQQAIDMAKTARAAREPASRAAEQITTSLRIPTADGIVALLAAGYASVEATRWYYEQRSPVNDVAQGLQRAGISETQLPRDLVSGGFSAADAVTTAGRVYNRSVNDIARELRAFDVRIATAATALHRSGFGCDAVAAALRSAGFPPDDVRSAIASEFGPFPSVATAEPGTPQIASFTIDGGTSVTQSSAVSLAWSAQGCAPAQVRFSESYNFTGAAWQSVSAAASRTGLYSGIASYTFQQDAPGQKTIYMQARNEAGESLPGSATIEYRKLITITDVRLNQGASETNSRAVQVDVAWDGAAPTHMRIAEQNITQQPWQAFSQFTTFNPPTVSGSGYGITQTFPIESPGFGPKTVWVQLMRNDANTVSDPVSAEITYGVLPRFHEVEPGAFDTRKVYTLTLYVTGLNSDVWTIANAKLLGGGFPYCAFNEYVNPLGAGSDAVDGNYDPNPVQAYQVTSIDDETFRLRFSGFFNILDTGRRWCQLRLSAELRAQNGASLGPLSVLQPDLFVEIVHPLPREKIIVENTWDLQPYIDVTGGDVVTSNSWGLCDGTLIGPAGSFDVGVLQVGGDIAFVTRSAPTGTTCDRTVGASRLRPGWRVDFEFDEESTGGVCIVSRDGTPRDGRLSKYAFGRGAEFIGWEQVNNVFGTGFPAPGGGYVWKTRKLFTTCSPTPSNDQEVRSIIRRAVIHVPQDAPQNPTLSDAFTG